MVDIPNIRFKEFTDDWEWRKLGKVFHSLQNNTFSRADLSTEQGVAKNIHYGDILVKFREILNIGKEHLPMITNESVVAKYKTSFLQNGDIVVADTAEDETVGKCSEIAGVGKETVIAGLHTIPYRPSTHFASGYLGYYMNSNAYHRQLLPLMQGIKVTSISKSAMQNTDIVYPKSQDEQAKIGLYFGNFDHLIILYQRKYDKLKEIKKCMLQKMFPQKNKRIPEIRFAGFTGDWELRKLGEIATFINGRAYSQPELLSEGKYKVLRVGNFYTNNSWYYSDLELEEKYYADYGDLLYTWSATFGPHIWLGDRVIYHYHIWKVELSDYLDKYFALQLFEKDKSDILLNKNGSTMIHITKEGMEDKKVIIPKDIREQCAIGQLLNHLDLLITLYRRKCDELKEVKKYMLQNMFPQKG